MWNLSLFALTLGLSWHLSHGVIPIVLNTWRFPEAAQKVWLQMQQKHVSAVDGVTMGCQVCEELQCEHTVGFGGSPDENGETILDAMIFDGATMNMGAVGGLRRVKNAIRVARHVLENTEHSFLVGDLATDFAKKFNFSEEPLSTKYSLNLWTEWKSNQCQPNFWKNVEPNPREFCGPYKTEVSNNIPTKENSFSSENHDTIGMIVIDADANVAAGTSTNGAKFKVPGRVGDSPIPGAGAYADNEVGAAVATGDGDIMMRFLPSFLAVEELRNGASPRKAAETAIRRIAEKYPNFFGAVLVATNKGEFGAACHGMDTFPFSVASSEEGRVIVQTIPCNK